MRRVGLREEEETTDISSEHYKTMLKYSACDEDVDLGRPCLSLNCKCTGFKPHPWRFYKKKCELCGATQIYKKDSKLRAPNVSGN
ncbi:unnamed protein product [Brugia pahangi]|uniref:GATA-type domain-containing protein n=1 Tax=Brugia pahangi TaxID=6280 RepID=A0A0N4TUG2_BRUPA|nr:unnamed protein product [Brugia pahangi]